MSTTSYAINFIKFREVECRDIQVTFYSRDAMVVFKQKKPHKVIASIQLEQDSNMRQNHIFTQLEDGSWRSDWKLFLPDPLHPEPEYTVVLIFTTEESRDLRFNSSKQKRENILTI